MLDTNEGFYGDRAVKDYIKFAAVIVWAIFELIAYLGGLTVGVAIITSIITGDSTITIINHRWGLK